MAALIASLQSLLNMAVTLVEQCGAGLLAFIVFNMNGDPIESVVDSNSKSKVLTAAEVEGYRETGILHYPGQVFEPEEWKRIKTELVLRLKMFGRKDGYMNI